VSAQTQKSASPERDATNVLDSDEVIEQKLIQKAKERLEMKKKTNTSCHSGVLPERPTVLESGYNSETEKSPNQLKMKVVEIPGFGFKPKFTDSGQNSPESGSGQTSNTKFSSPESVVSGSPAASPVAAESRDPAKPGPSADRSKSRPEPRSILNISRKCSGTDVIKLFCA